VHGSLPPAHGGRVHPRATTATSSPARAAGPAPAQEPPLRYDLHRRRGRRRGRTWIGVTTPDDPLRPDAARPNPARPPARPPQPGARPPGTPPPGRPEEVEARMREGSARLSEVRAFHLRRATLGAREGRGARVPLPGSSASAGRRPADEGPARGADPLRLVRVRPGGGGAGARAGVEAVPRGPRPRGPAAGPARGSGPVAAEAAAGRGPRPPAGPLRDLRRARGVARLARPRARSPVGLHAPERGGERQPDDRRPSRRGRPDSATTRPPCDPLSPGGAKLVVGHGRSSHHSDVSRPDPANPSGSGRATSPTAVCPSNRLQWKELDSRDAHPEQQASHHRGIEDEEGVVVPVVSNVGGAPCGGLQRRARLALQWRPEEPEPSA